MIPIQEKIFVLAEEDFNIASPKQLGEILYNKLGFKGGKKGKSGLYSTSAEVLEKLGQDGNEICKLVISWRGLQKLKSTYSDALVEQINPSTNRVHTHFQMTGAMTGRFSSSTPNLQNIPIKSADGRAIRKAFIAQKGKKLKFNSNNAGGILGGISSGQQIIVSFAVKPTSSILKSRKTVNKLGKNTTISVKGRHDPCVGIRAVPVGEAMLSCVLLDHYLMHKAQCG